MLSITQDYLLELSALGYAADDSNSCKVGALMYLAGKAALKSLQQDRKNEIWDAYQSESTAMRHAIAASREAERKQDEESEQST